MQLAKDVDPKQFEKKTTGFTQLHYKEEIDNAKRDGLQPNVNGFYKQVKLLPLTDVKFANVFGSENNY